MGKVKKFVGQQKSIKEREKQLDLYLGKHKIEGNRNNSKPGSRKITYIEFADKKQGEKGINFRDEKLIGQYGSL